MDFACYEVCKITGSIDNESLEQPEFMTRNINKWQSIIIELLLLEVGRIPGMLYGEPEGILTDGSPTHSSILELKTYLEQRKYLRVGKEREYSNKVS